ncbi:calcium-binding protein [uncultured Tateyamaria sp.]|uniref:calcium-binding protein n=1 Tax=uncultured Tateyamaria sp. TaxID=455651 RepID=UPI00260BA05B|nr:calcium-binding protein [uncultured Tateyamaria sp.]
MPATQPAISLETIAEIVETEPGLIANIYPDEIQAGADAARLMNGVIETAIAATGVNADGKLTPGDLYTLSAFIRADAGLYATFLEGHGDDEGNEETGFHLVQGDGGALIFQGRDFVDTVADAIYHVGFAIVDGRFQNEDGNANETVEDIAGWMNYYVNGQNRVYGTEAGETLHSGHYSFALDAAADEIFQAFGGDDRVWGGLGNDSIYAGAGDDRAGGGDGADRLYGGTGNDHLNGDAGNDRLFGEAGDDTLGGNDGDDRAEGGAGEDRIYGDAGNDTLRGGADADTVAGGTGNDYLTGDDGNDRIWGDDGDDRIFGGQGDDRADGGAGDDLIYLNAGNDSAWGADGDDRISGGAGNDDMGGGTGNDTLLGEAGNDSLGGQEGNDLLNGGSGNDTLRGGDDNDRLIGDSGNDSLRGEDGDDRISGGRGADDIHGGDGRDTVSGGSGNDTVSGGNGEDIIMGRAGADLLLDYEDIEARDTFVFYQGDSGTTAATMDVIRGFTSIIDSIDLTDFGGLTFVTGTAFSGTQSEVLFDGDFVQIDSNGDGVVDEMIELEWVNAVEAADFIL